MARLVAKARLVAFQCVLTAAFAVAALGTARPARAETASTSALPVVVLALDSDDAEQQADAMTGALRSRIRASQGLSLVENSASLGMLTAALKCPARPTPECQDKIADQVKSSLYVYGFVTKGPKGQVTAEVHLYQRGKPDAVAKESYAESLSDANDDSLREVAKRVLDKISSTALGTIVVRAPKTASEVVLDGQKKTPLADGTTRLSVAPGSHSVEVALPGAPQKRTVLVEAGKEVPADLMPPRVAATGAAPPGEGEEESRGVSGRKVVGAILMAGGVGLGVLGVERALRYSEMKDQLGEVRFRQAINDTGGRAVDACDATGPGAELACNVSKNAKGVSAVAIASGATGAVLLGAGAYLLFAGGSDDGDRAGKTGAARPRLVPILGRDTQGLGLSGSF